MQNLTKKINEVRDDEWVGLLFRIFYDDDWSMVMGFESFIDYALTTQKFDKRIEEMRKEK